MREKRTSNVDKDKLLKKYQKFIEVSVNAFANRYQHTDSFMKDDLKQEASIAFLNFFDNQNKDDYNDENHMLAVCRKYMKYSMYSFVSRKDGLGINPKTFKGFYSNHNVSSFEDYNVDTSFEEDSSAVDVKIFLSKLPLSERRIVRLKMCGYTHREIAKIMKCSPAWVSMVLTRIRPKLKEFYRTK